MCFVPGKALILALTTLRSLVVLDVNRGGSATTVLHEASSQPVHSVAISADGELIATGGDDCVVKLWQGLLRWRGDGSLAHGGAARRAVPSSFIGHSKPITACAPSRLFRARAPANRSATLTRHWPLSLGAGSCVRPTLSVAALNWAGRERAHVGHQRPTCGQGGSHADRRARARPRGSRVPHWRAAAPGRGEVSRAVLYKRMLSPRGGGPVIVRTHRCSVVSAPPFFYTRAALAGFQC